MPGHLTPEQLARFIAGTLPDADAADAALHIDDCPLCANRVVVADPLSPYFAAVDDPQLEPEVRSTLLASLPEHPAETDVVKPWVGVTFLVAAATLMLAAGDPADLARRVGTLALSSCVGIAAVLRAFSGTSLLLASLALAALVFSVSAIRFLGLTRDAG